ncbi:MAG: hypothetical protein ACLR6J_16055 [Parabacteroides merdae]
MAEQSQQRLQAFRQYRSVARSPEAVRKTIRALERPKSACRLFVERK